MEDRYLTDCFFLLRDKPRHCPTYIWIVEQGSLEYVQASTLDDWPYSEDLCAIAHTSAAVSNDKSGGELFKNVAFVNILRIEISGRMSANDTPLIFDFPCISLIRCAFKWSSRVEVLLLNFSRKRPIIRKVFGPLTVCRKLPRSFY